MRKNKIFEILIPTESKLDILYKIKKYFKNPQGFFHIISLNPENLILANECKNFKKVIETAQLKIIDGIGIILAGKILKIKVGERIPGVDLMKELIEIANEMRLRVLLIGGRGNLADSLANCYQKKYPKAKFKGIEGIKNIKNNNKKVIKAEEEVIFSIVSDFKPHLVLVAFGSPYQELWIERHKDKFKNCIVMGVGGAFDFLGGRVPRAPVFLRKLGLEWFFRLIIQPWRWRRQVRLIKFLWLIVKDKLKVKN